MGYGDHRDDENRQTGDRWQGRDSRGRMERERGRYGDWGSDQDRGRRGGSDDRGFFERAGEEVRSWFSDDDDRGGRSGYGNDWDQDRNRDAQSFGGGFGNQRGWGDHHFDRQTVGDGGRDR